MDLSKKFILFLFFLATFTKVYPVNTNKLFDEYSFLTLRKENNNYIINKGNYEAVWYFDKEKPFQFAVYKWPDTNPNKIGKTPQSLKISKYPELKKLKIVMFIRISLLEIQSKKQKETLFKAKKNVFNDIMIKTIYH